MELWLGGECCLLGFPKALKTCTDFNGLTFFKNVCLQIDVVEGESWMFKNQNEKDAAHVRGTNRG